MRQRQQQQRGGQRGRRRRARHARRRQVLAVHVALRPGVRLQNPVVHLIERHLVFHEVEQPVDDDVDVAVVIEREAVHPLNVVGVSGDRALANIEIDGCVPFRNGRVAY